MAHDLTLTDLALTLPVPDGWEVGTIDLGGLAGEGGQERDEVSPGRREEQLDGSVIALVPGDWGPERGFRPSLTVTAVESEPALTPHRAGTEALALILTENDTHVAAYDVWAGGRRLTWLSWAQGEQLVVAQWVLARATRVVTITATVDAERWTSTRPLLQAMVEEARWDDEPAAEQPYEPRWRRARLGRGPTEPRRDTDLAALGENVEDLSRVGGEQRFRPSGVTLDREGLFAFLEAQDAPPVTPELVDVGLADKGGVASAGHRIRTIVRDADRVVQVEASVGLLPLSFTLYRRAGDAVIVCTDGVSQWAGSDPHGRALGQIPTRVHLMDVSAVGSLGVLVSWLGVSPAWSLAVEDELAQDKLMARLNDPGMRTPRGASAQLQQIWPRLGALWTLRAHDRPTQSSVGMAVVDAADRGVYQLRGVGAATDGDAPASATDGATPTVATDGAATDVSSGRAADAREAGDRLVLEALPGAALLDELVRLVIDPAQLWLPLTQEAS